MKLYELVLRKGRAVSPFVWRAKLCLAHKGLEYETVPIGYGDKEQLKFSGQDRVPVLVDGDHIVADSWKIACYLDDAYPDKPSLIGEATTRGTARFFNHWADNQQLGALFFICAPGTYDVTPENDQPYFAASRQEWTGMTIDDMRAMQDRQVEKLRSVLAPLRTTFLEQPWISGDDPAWADYCLFGGFMWARTTTSVQLLEKDDPVEDWRQRMLNLFDGLGRKVIAIQKD